MSGESEFFEVTIITHRTCRVRRGESTDKEVVRRDVRRMLRDHDDGRNQVNLPTSHVIFVSDPVQTDRG